MEHYTAESVDLSGLTIENRVVSLSGDCHLNNTTFKYCSITIEKSSVSIENLTLVGCTFFMLNKCTLESITGTFDVESLDFTDCPKVDKKFIETIKTTNCVELCVERCPLEDLPFNMIDEKLTILYLTSCKITSIGGFYGCFSGALDLSDNPITDVEGFYFAGDSLKLNNCKIQSLYGIEEIGCESVGLANNPLVDFDGFDLITTRHIDLDGCNLESLQNLELNKCVDSLSIQNNKLTSLEGLTFFGSCLLAKNNKELSSLTFAKSENHVDIYIENTKFESDNNIQTNYVSANAVFEMEL